MPKNCKRILTDVSELLNELAAAKKRIGRLTAQLKDLGAEPWRDEDRNAYLFRRVDELELSVRSMRLLENAGIQVIWQLVEKTESVLLKQKNLVGSP